MAVSTSSLAAPSRRSGVAAVAIVTALLAVHFILAVGSKRHASTTSDEIAHLTGGFSYWAQNDYRLHPENGILPQRWAALPAWLAGAKFPPLIDNEYWSLSDVWVVGHQFFYETGEDHFPRLMAGRAMIGLFSVATGLLIFGWSRRLFGLPGALVSLAFFTFSPIFLAHGALVTSDACMAFFFLAATGAWWAHLHDPRPRTWLLSALLFGLAMVAKYSAVLLIPMAMVMGLVRALAPGSMTLFGRTFITRGGKFGAAALSGLGHAAVAAVIIWACYGFRYAAFNPAAPPARQFIRSWEISMAGLGTTGQWIEAAGRAHLLPEAFLYGFAYVLETVKARAAYLNGEYSLSGWPSFFLWTFLLKTTVPVLIASVVTAYAAARRWAGQGYPKPGSDFYRATPLITLFGIYWASSLTSHLNIGHRHILPTYPVIFIALGALAHWSCHSWVRRTVLLGLIGWHVVSALRITPYFLAYFNGLAGGPEKGYRHLVDSSLDWGQDLPALKKWLAAHPTEQPVYLSYFGTGQPGYYGLRVRPLAYLNNFKFPSFYVPTEPGIYCISATTLTQVYSPTGGKWTREYEQEYQQLLAMRPRFLEYTENASAKAELDRTAPPGYWPGAIRRHDFLRLARLCHYLRVRQPDDQAGYSILIYRLSAAELSGATEGPLAEWLALMETAAAQP